MKKYKIMILVVCLLSGCTSATDVAQKAGQVINDEIKHQASKVDPNVLSVKGGTLGEYTNITVGEAFETFFADPKWKYFKADTEEDVVEFTGYCTYQDVKVLARLQFIVNEETFEIGALSFNDVPQNELIKASLLSKIYEHEDAAESDNMPEESTASDSLVSNELVTVEVGDQFTESVIGFDLKEFMNMKFEVGSEIQEFLNRYGYEITNGDIGAFHAVDELETDLFITTREDYENGWHIDLIKAEVPSYVMNLNEVKDICDPNNEKQMLYDDSDNNARYYYSTEIDGVQVNYNFSYDSLREKNPRVLSITLIVKGKEGDETSEIACECLECWSENGVLYKEGSSLTFKCGDCNTFISWEDMEESLVNQVFSSMEIVRFGGRAAGQCSQCGRGPAFAIKEGDGSSKEICINCGSIFEY